MGKDGCVEEINTVFWLRNDDDYPINDLLRIGILWFDRPDRR